MRLYHADNFDFGMTTEVHQQSKFKTGGFEIVQKLRFMFWSQSFN